MSIREIIYYPDDVLVEPARDVEAVDDEVRQLVDDLVDTMYAAPGIGLAAPQIGVSLRVAVIDVTGPEERKDLRVLINPKVVSGEGHLVWEEGCLSFPGLYEKVPRYRKVIVEGLDRDGEPWRVEAEDLLAVAMQHEIDHLDGILFIDRITPLKRRLAMKKYRRFLQKRAESPPT